MKLTDKIQIIKTMDSNFEYGEFIKSNVAQRLNIKNIPTPDQWKNIEILTNNILQPVRDKFGSIRITSGFRSVELCEAIGSSKYSNHAKGESADIEPYDSTISLWSILDWIYNNCEFRELIAEYFPHGWIHVTYRKGANNKQLKLKDKNHNYKKMTYEEIKNIYGNKF